MRGHLFKNLNVLRNSSDWEYKFCAFLPIWSCMGRRGEGEGYGLWERQVRRNKWYIFDWSSIGNLTNRRHIFNSYSIRILKTKLLALEPILFQHSLLNLPLKTLSILYIYPSIPLLHIFAICRALIVLLAVISTLFQFTSLFIFESYNKTNLYTIFSTLYKACS